MSVEASDRGRGNRGLPGHQVPRMESALNPAVTKGQLNIKLLSMAAESTSPVPPGQEGGPGQPRKKQGDSVSVACFLPPPTLSLLGWQTLVNPKEKGGREKGGLRILGTLGMQCSFSHITLLTRRQQTLLQR